MTTIETIERVLASRILIEQLTVVPPRGATAPELSEGSKNLGQLDSALVLILQRWNGIDLDVIRIHGLGDVELGIRTMDKVGGRIRFASDPAGFSYLLGADGQVVMIDHDGGGMRNVAADLDDFVQHFVFGSRAEEFGGPEWANLVEKSLLD